MKTVMVLGSFSGNNAGDAAILMSLIRDISEISPETRFLVPTLRPSFITKNFSPSVQPIDIKPWKLSLKLLGLPVLSHIKKADIILITDAICFDVHLWNPLDNNLFALVIISWVAKLLKKPVVFFNNGVGPLNTKLGKKMMRYVGSNADLIILRDEDSKKLLHRIGVKKDIIVKADSALNLQSSSDETIKKVLEENNIPRNKRFIGINVTKYADSWLKKGERSIGKKRYQEIIAQVSDALIKKFGIPVLFIPTHPMDCPFTKGAYNLMKEKDNAYIISRHYTPDKICGLLKLCEFIIGTRFHSTVLSSATHTPVISIIYTPKNRSLMKQLGIEEYGIEFNDLSVKKLFTLSEKLWKNRKRIKNQLSIAVEKEKKKAKDTVLIFHARYYHKMTQR
jgi:polysaccharide pyruvyl transferase WcaK-like protein